MKTWKFKIREYNFSGFTVREIEVVARTERSAFNKIYHIQGTRDCVINLKSTTLKVV